MTPEQMLTRVAPAAPPVIEGEVVNDLIVCLGGGGVHYTSETMEEDFSDAVELLMQTTNYLAMLGDAHQAFDLMGNKVKESFDKHVEEVRNFVGMWEND